MSEQRKFLYLCVMLAEQLAAPSPDPTGTVDDANQPVMFRKRIQIGYSTPAALLAANLTEARRMYAEAVRKECPEEDGWTGHQYLVEKVGDDMIRAAMDQLTLAWTPENAQTVQDLLSQPIVDTQGGSHVSAQSTTR